MNYKGYDILINSMWVVTTKTDTEIEVILKSVERKVYILGPVTGHN